MKIAKTSAAQGDCLFRRIAKLPPEAKEVPRNGPIIVAHSETGHHHAISATAKARFFEMPGDPLRAFVVVEDPEGADVVHHRSWDTHETLRLLSDGEGEAIWEIRRQREHTPEGWRRVED